jgi:HAD superfamily hydrolase (TIGR01509 family)
MRGGVKIPGLAERVTRTYRSKPGAKYRYRYSTEHLTPEWGVWPCENMDRYVAYGEVWVKGTPVGKKNYEKAKADKERYARGQVDSASGAPEAALLVDCDGTLAETERDGHRVAFNRAFEEMGYDCAWDVDLYGELLTTGGGKERMARYFADYSPEAWPHPDPPAKDHPEIARLHELKTELFMDIVRTGQLPLREGVLELLTAARDAGWPIAVCSTSSESSVRAVVETLLPDLSASIRIFAGDCVPNKKPDPEIYLLASQELGLAPMKCVVLEDTNIGVQAGRDAGMNVVATKSFYSQEEDFSDADIVVGSAAEVDFEKRVCPLLPQMMFA